MSGRKQVVILGGGISGLTAAWKLARSSKGSSLNIKLLEASPRVGGWIKSNIVPGVTTFECGPRSLRPAGLSGLATLDLIDKLNLTEKIVPVSKSEPASKNRSIFYNNQLHQLPSSLMGMLTNRSPVLKGFLYSALQEPFIKTRIDPNGDESIHDFMTRRFGKDLALNLMSAVVHGIYAGDSSKLSVRSTFKILYELERDHGSVVKGVFARMRAPENPELAQKIQQLKVSNPKLASVFSDASMYSFEGGIEELSLALIKDLQNLSNVEILVDSSVSNLVFDDSRVRVHTSSSNRTETIYGADHVISTIPSLMLDKVIDKTIPELTYNPSVTVAVVSFAYKKKVLPQVAFGYLVPRSVKDSTALGVVFDSCSFPAASPAHESLTVMMGGHQFSDRVGDPSSVTEKDLLTKAYGVLEKQINITDVPVAHQVVLQRNCIPQYYVNHPQRMQSLHETIKSNFSGKLSLAGASYTGVAINDCIFYSEKLTEDLLTNGSLSNNPSQIITGLESCNIKA